MATRLCSLWDMINLPIGKLAAAAMEVTSFSQMVSFSLQHNAGGLILWDDVAGVDGVPKLGCAIDDIVSVAELLGMPVTLHHAKILRERFKAISRFEGDQATILDSVLANALEYAISAMATALRTESEARVAVVLPMDKLSFYEPTAPLFGIEVAVKFTAVAYDLKEASNCLALGCSTATVFHLMRILEIALKATNSCLGLPMPANRNWGGILAQIRDERLKRGGTKWADNDFFQDVWQRMDSIKDAQRNTTMHVESIYTEEEASVIFESTKAFMKKIASRMDEDGNPKA